MQWGQTQGPRLPGGLAWGLLSPGLGFEREACPLWLPEPSTRAWAPPSAVHTAAPVLGSGSGRGALRKGRASPGFSVALCSRDDAPTAGAAEPGPARSWESGKRRHRLLP